VLFALAAWVWTTLRPKPAVTEFRKIPLTTYPGRELDPTFSPDGRQIAFAWNGEKDSVFHIYVKLVDGGEPLRITNDPAGERGPAWSPDGRFIAFHRQGAIYLISPLGGTERKVADAAGDAAPVWTPDGTSIAFIEKPPPYTGPVVLLNLETGERRNLTDPPRDSGGDRRMTFSPDGKRLAFGRARASSGGSELYVMALPNGPPKRIDIPTNVIADLVWMPDGKELLARFAELGYWRVPLEAAAPSPIAGLEDAAGPASASAIFGGSQRLIYTRFNEDQNIWTLADSTKFETDLIHSTRIQPAVGAGRKQARVRFRSERLIRDLRL